MTLDPPESTVDAPLFVSAPYEISVGVLLAALPSRALAGIAVLLCVAMIATGTHPLTAIPVVAALVVVMLLVVVLRTPAAARAPRTFALWPDGRYRIDAAHGSQIEGTLGAARHVDRRFGTWRIRMSNRFLIVVPADALSTEQHAAVRAAVDGRRSLGLRTTTYTADPLSTVPLDVAVGDLLPWTLLRATSRILPVFAVFSVVMGGLARSALVGVLGFVALSVWFLGALTIQTVRNANDPSSKQVRFAITGRGLETSSAVASSVLHPSQLQRVDSGRHGLVVRAGRVLVIPPRAFRDDEHRATFEAALRKLVEPR